MKNLIIVVLLLGIISVGISYSIYNSPDLPLQNMYKMALTEFAKQAEPFEQEFTRSSQFKTQDKLVEFDTNSPDGANTHVAMTLTTTSAAITLSFMTGEFALAGETIILEPELKEGVIHWKCINGSVLVRIRTKNCRLGYGETRLSMLAYQ